MTLIPQELPPASILPSLSPLSDTNPPAGPPASLTAPTAPTPAQLQLNSLTPKGIQVLWELCSCSKHWGLFPSLPSPHTECAQGASQLPPLPRRVWSSHKVPPFPLPGMQPEPRLLQTRREEGRGVLRGRARIREGQNPPSGYLELQPGAGKCRRVKCRSALCR